MFPADTPHALLPLAAKASSIVQSGQGYPTEPPPIQGDDGVWTVALAETVLLPALVIKLTRDQNRGPTRPVTCINTDPNSAAPFAGPRGQRVIGTRRSRVRSHCLESESNLWAIAAVAVETYAAADLARCRRLPVLVS